jgi:hypothetical protein
VTEFGKEVAGMNGTVGPLSLITKRKGSFGDYEIIGKWYENLNGQRSWHIRSWNSDSDFTPQHSWVGNGEIYDVNLVPVLSALGTYFEVSELDADMKPDRREAIHAAIRGWEV